MSLEDELENARQAVEEAEERCSSMVSARDLTIRDLRAALADAGTQLQKCVDELAKAYATAGRLLNEDTAVRRALGASPHETTLQAAEIAAESARE
jgi:hypothetical protein